MIMSECLTVQVRPAQENDTADMLEVTSHIWEGHDYVPLEWPAWLADPEGALLVAEYNGRVIGFGKLSRLADEDWWLQGMRVHPEFESHGVASQITESLVATWRAQSRGTVRLATSSQRLPVHHLCDRLGFAKVGEYSVFVANAADEEMLVSGSIPQEFQLLSISEAVEAAEYVRQSPTLALANGIMDLGWRWAPPRPDYYRQAIGQERAWWWRGRQGLLAIYIDQDDEDIEPPRTFLQAAACELEQLKPMLLDYRRLTASLGYQNAGWNAALHPALLPVLEQAGFQRTWEHALFVYSKS
jgi:GNAT superfamily N-acetyltransferase